MERIIFLIDMDCFYVQVEQKLQPDTVKLPCAVVQYTSISAASLIAVSYEARERGVTRNMTGDAAKKRCPELILFQVPMNRGKADLTKYREAGAEVIKSISKFTSKIERASIDEAFIDVTDLVSDVPDRVSVSEKSNLVVDPDTMNEIFPNIEVDKCPCSVSLGRVSDQNTLFDKLSDGRKLKSALILAQKVKDQILEDTGYCCSVGIANNRMLGKIACSLNKPDRITLVPLEARQHLMNHTRTKKVPGLGGKLGLDLIARFDLEYVGALTKVPLKKLVEVYGEKTGNWLYELCRGNDYQAVSTRTLVKSIACSKNFLGKSALRTETQIRQWLEALAGELVERVALDREKHNRLPTSLSLSLRAEHVDMRSKALQPTLLSSILPRENVENYQETEARIAKRIADLAFTALKGLAGDSPILNMGLMAGKFKSDHAESQGDVKEMFQRHSKVNESPGKRESFFKKFIEIERASPPSKRPAVEGVVETQEEPVPSTSSGKGCFQKIDPSIDTMICPECGSHIPVHLMPEHSDFHFAKKLQQEWNQEVSTSVQAKPQQQKSIRGNARNKPGRGRKSKPASRTMKLDQFLIKRQ